MGQLKTYNPGQVSVTFGPNILSGFGDGSITTVVRNEDTWTHKKGTDGKGTRSKSNNKGGIITVTLDQASSANAVLSTIAKVDELSATQILPIVVRDASGNTLHTGEEAWIAKPPDSELGRESLDREWTFQVDDLEMFDGGN